MKIDIYNVTEETCNAVIDHLMNEEQKISDKISAIIISGNDSSEAEEEYNHYCDVMDQVLEFRRNHSCAVKGDDNYSVNIFG